MGKKIIESAFQVGDVVKLKSGGPDMTVNYIIGTNKENDFNYTAMGHTINNVECKWFENETLKSSILSPLTLVKI